MGKRQKTHHFPKCLELSRFKLFCCSLYSIHNEYPFKTLVGVSGIPGTPSGINVAFSIGWVREMENKCLDVIRVVGLCYKSKCARQALSIAVCLLERTWVEFEFEVCGSVQGGLVLRSSFYVIFK